MKKVSYILIIALLLPFISCKDRGSNVDRRKKKLERKKRRNPADCPKIDC